MTKFRFSGLISALFLFLFQQGVAQKQNPDVVLVQKCINALSEVMMHDITSPPVASRDYAYSLIAFYEAARPSDSAYESYGGKLNGLKPLPGPDVNAKYDWLVAGAQAFYKTSFAFVFSKTMFQRSWDSIESNLHKRKVSSEVFARSVQFGNQVAQHILQWAGEDNYSHTRTLPRFTPGETDSTWKPTGPDYMDAIEPNWKLIRPLALKNSDQFLAPRPATYKSEEFMAECKEVFKVNQNPGSEENSIANFWDCNPYATTTIGHLMYSVKKITPGGHWIGITGIAIKERNQSLLKALTAYSIVSITIFDSFISAWDEKYRSDYLRPITAIHQLISPTWEPILQTPPFPEYPSAHSVISMASATILTHLYGENFHFIDYVEKPFGLPDRAFNSFYDAANEAAISRMYGGIHFREAIENGKIMGKSVGDYVLEKLASKN